MTGNSHLETQAEELLVRLVKQAGGQCHKMTAGGGIPDRLVMMPEGRFFLVELKQDDTDLDPLQVVWHDRARAIGFDPITLHGKAEVRAWVAQITSDLL